MELVINEEYGSLLGVLSQNIEGYTRQYYNSRVPVETIENKVGVNADDFSFDIKIESGNNYVKHYFIPSSFKNTRNFIKGIIDIED